MYGGGPFFFDEEEWFVSVRLERKERKTEYIWERNLGLGPKMKITKQYPS